VPGGSGLVLPVVEGETGEMATRACCGGGCVGLLLQRDPGHSHDFQNELEGSSGRIGTSIVSLLL